MIILQNVSYNLPNKELLFKNVNLTVNNNNKIALIGNNGSGKSTLLKIIAGIIKHSDGTISVESKPYYIPQILACNELTISEALGIKDKLAALKEITEGNVTEQNFSILNDDWTIEERCNEALEYWQLTEFNTEQKLGSLSGGQKTKIFLAGISIHKPEIILLDEPSNHLDNESRQILYNFIESYNGTMLVVSHDRKLLNLLNTTCELTSNGITTYGGNYDFYYEQKQIEINALNNNIADKKKALKKAKEKERETVERKQKLDSRGKKKQTKAGVSKIMMNAMKNNAEKSTSKLQNSHNEKVSGIFDELENLRASVPEIDKMKFGFDNSNLHNGKILLKATNINFAYDNIFLWSENKNFQISSGERIVIKGNNGSGKTTLIKIILGMIKPQTGTVFLANNKTAYIDQDYSLLNDEKTVYEQAQTYNYTSLQEHEIKTRLTRFLFTKDDWDKKCEILSGGEKMRLILCCLTIGSLAPDIIILDEPTNNLDIQNIEILTVAINDYKGTLIVVSHDEYFLNQININKTIML